MYVELWFGAWLRLVWRVVLDYVCMHFIGFLELDYIDDKLYVCHFDVNWFFSMIFIVGSFSVLLQCLVWIWVLLHDYYVCVATELHGLCCTECVVIYGRNVYDYVMLMFMFVWFGAVLDCIKHEHGLFWRQQTIMRFWSHEG